MPFYHQSKRKGSFHTNHEDVGKTISVSEGRSTLLFGGTSISTGDSDGETVVRGSAPIMKETGSYEEIIGTVSVEFLKEISTKRQLINSSN